MGSSFTSYSWVDSLCFVSFSFVLLSGHILEHVVGYERMVFGRGQVIRRLGNGMLACGSDGRADGMACGY